MRHADDTPQCSPKACPWQHCGVSRFAVLFFVSLLLACVPLDVRPVFSTDAPFTLEAFKNSGRAHISRNTAQADTVDEYNSFIDEMAEQAGMSSSDYIAVITGVNNISTGISFVKNGGLIGLSQQAGVTVSGNLSSLVDAADYPDWNTLTNEQRESWGTREAYEASKFNSLMDAYGLGDARDRFYESGGGNFEWQQDEIDKLQAIGRIGQNWARGAANSVRDLFGLYDDRAYLGKWLGNQTMNYDAGSDSNWPSGLPGNIQYTVGNVFKFTNSIFFNGRYYVTNPEVYCFVTTHVSGYNVYRFNMFSLTPAKLSYTDNPSTANPNENFNEVTLNNKTFYKLESGSNMASNFTTQLPTYDNTNLTLQQWNYVYYSILFGDFYFENTDIPQYPEGNLEKENPTGNIFFPVGGIGVSTPFPSYTTQPTTPRPENDYNPDNQTETPEWKNETSENLGQLQGIEFDKLFPFSLLYDLRALFEKVQGTFEDDGLAYNVIDVPIDYGVDSDTAELDLTWLHDLAILVRPFFQILLGTSLLAFTIWLWRNILTG